VPVLVNEQRKKLSKRRDKVALEQYRAEGYLAPAMVNYLMTLGWAPSGDTEIVPWSRIEAEFRLEEVNHAPAYFDVKKLNAFNAEYLRMMTPEDFRAAAAAWVPPEWDRAVLDRVIDLAQTRVVTLADVAPMFDFLFLPDAPVDEAAWSKVMSAPTSVPMLREVADAFAGADWRADVLKVTVEEIGLRHELKPGKAQAPVRLAVTGRTVGPPLYESLEVLGRAETARRLHAAIERAAGGVAGT
jgi:glutamyl-tRNA synthetase